MSSGIFRNPLRVLLSGFTAAAGTVAATDSILTAIQKIVGNISERAVSGVIGSSGLTMNTNRVLLRSTAGAGAVEEGTLGGALSLIGTKLAFSDVMVLTVSNTGETVTVRANHVEKSVQRACTVTGVFWEVAPTAPGGSSSQAMVYARRSGTKTNLLSANASLAASAILTDATNLLTGTLTLAAGDSVGVNLEQVGTQSSGHQVTVLLLYS